MIHKCIVVKIGGNKQYKLSHKNVHFAEIWRRVDENKAALIEAGFIALLQFTATHAWLFFTTVRLWCFRQAIDEILFMGHTWNRRLNRNFRNLLFIKAAINIRSPLRNALSRVPLSIPHFNVLSNVIKNFILFQTQKGQKHGQRQEKRQTQRQRQKER